MRTFFFFTFCFLALLVGCVDPDDPDFNATVNVVVVDGTLTDLAEPQLVRLNRSRADSLTGRFGSTPITGIRVEVVVDSGQVIALKETDPGTYRFPEGYRGQTGHSYQLRFWLRDGTRYESSQEVLQAAPPIDKVSAEFNPRTIPANRIQGFTAGHDFYLDTNDPSDAHNYYRWDWALYERQEWCRTCYESQYAINNVERRIGLGVYAMGNKPFEACFAPPFEELYAVGLRDRNLDYNCRTLCWEIIRNFDLNLFDDQFTNGGPILARKVAQIPFYQRRPCLVEIRQSALTAEAFRYFKLFQEQTQNTGGLADTPPTALVGNVRNVANRQENVVGYFAATGVATLRYWLDRRDAVGPTPGLFQGLNAREPVLEPSPPNSPPLLFIGQARPPTATCVLSDSRTPAKPEGWRE